MEENPINAVLGLIGLFLLVEGIWIVSAPTSTGMIVDGIALLILGAWNIFITIANSAAGSGGGPHFFAILGVWQIIWGFQSFGRYKRFSVMPMKKPSEEILRQIDGLVKTITKAKVKEQPDLVEFQTKTFTARQAWKGKLSQRHSTEPALVGFPYGKQGRSAFGLNIPGRYFGCRFRLSCSERCSFLQDSR